MAILGKDILEKHGPYIWFSVVDFPFDDEWPDRSKYEGGIFIEFADDLLGTYCSMTQSYSPFSPYDFTQLEKPHAIYEFTSKLLMWESQLAKTPENYFEMRLKYFRPDESYLKGEKYTREQLKADMIETLHFMIGEMHKAAASNKCVIIAGI